MPNMAYAQAENLTEPGNKLVNAKMMQDLLKSRAERLHTSGPDPDTVWFGHSYTDHWSATANYWNLYTGVNFPGISDPTNAIWGTGITEPAFRTTASATPAGMDDASCVQYHRRLPLPGCQPSWWAIDIGNQGELRDEPRTRQADQGVVGVWHADQAARPARRSWVAALGSSLPFMVWSASPR